MRLVWIFLAILSMASGSGTASAQAPTGCSYAKTGDEAGGGGIALERGVVTCSGTDGARYTHVSNVVIATIDLTMPGRFLATSGPTSSSKISGIDNFTLQLPTDYLASLGQHRVAPEPYGPTGQIAVNANLFTNSPIYSKSKGLATGIRGLQIAKGQINVGPQGNPDFSCFMESGKCFKRKYDASLIVTGAANATIAYTNSATYHVPGGLPGSGPTMAVTGSNMLVFNGAVVAPVCPIQPCTTEFFGPNSRTAIGLTQDRRTLVLVVADSRTDSAAQESGLQLDELAWLMLQRNVYAAINLDGGGSSLMAVRQALTVRALNRPRQDPGAGLVCDSIVNGGCQRYVGNSLGIGYTSGVGDAAPAQNKAEPSAGTPVQTIVVFRHGEKPVNAVGQLAPAGLARSLKLPAVLSARFGTPVALFAPNPSVQIMDGNSGPYSYVRPLATIEPTAILMQPAPMPVNTQIGYTSVAQLAQALLIPDLQTGATFVAWERGHNIPIVNSLLQLLQQQGIDTSAAQARVPTGWPECDYDTMYVLTITRGDIPSVQFDIVNEGLGRDTGCPCQYYPGTNQPNCSTATK